MVARCLHGKYALRITPSLVSDLATHTPQKASSGPVIPEPLGTIPRARKQNGQPESTISINFQNLRIAKAMGHTKYTKTAVFCMGIKRYLEWVHTIFFCILSFLCNCEFSPKPSIFCSHHLITDFFPWINAVMVPIHTVFPINLRWSASQHLSVLSSWASCSKMLLIIWSP